MVSISCKCRTTAASAAAASCCFRAARMRRWPANDFCGRPFPCEDLSRVSRNTIHQVVHHLYNRAIARRQARWHNEIRCLPRWPGSPPRTLASWRARMSSISAMSSLQACRAARAATCGSIILRTSISSATSWRLSSSAWAKRIGRSCTAGIANHCAEALPRLKQPFQLQAADGVAHRATTDSQQSPKLPLRRQEIAGFKFFEDVPLQLAGDFLVDLMPGDRFEAGSRWCFHDMSWCTGLMTDQFQSMPKATGKDAGHVAT